jgi:hypothetical protein
VTGRLGLGLGLGLGLQLGLGHRHGLGHGLLLGLALALGCSDRPAPPTPPPPARPEPSPRERATVEVKRYVDGEIGALPDGEERLRRLREGLAGLDEAYRATGGDALPPVPEGFDPDHPSEAHLATPYGRLFALLAAESDPERAGSLAAALRETGLAIGIAPLAR